MVNYVCSGAADLVGRDHADHFCRPQGYRAIKLTCLRLAPFQRTTQELKTVWHWWGEEDICPKGNRSNVQRKNPVDTCKYLKSHSILQTILAFWNIGKALKDRMSVDGMSNTFGPSFGLSYRGFKYMICSSWTSGIKYNTYYCNWTAFQRPTLPLLLGTKVLRQWQGTIFAHFWQCNITYLAENSINCESETFLTFLPMIADTLTGAAQECLCSGPLWGARVC